MVDSSLVQEIFPEVVKDLQQQVNEEFLPVYGDKTIVPWTSSSSLFAIFIGINDVHGSFSTRNSTLNEDIFKEYRRLVDQVSSASEHIVLATPLMVFIQASPIRRT